MWRNVKYTAVDLAMLGVVATVSGVVFTLTWSVYYFASAIGGPILSRLLTYGLWFMAAPLAASLIKKPFSAFLGETLGALIETIIPTVGGFTNLIYGLAQGFASELAYVLTRYKRYGLFEAMLAGALAAPPCIALDAILFGEIYSTELMIILTIGAAISGAIYGAVAFTVARAVRR